MILEILGVFPFLNLQSWSHTADGQEDFMALGGAEGRAGPGGVGINFLKGLAFILEMDQRDSSPSPFPVENYVTYASVNTKRAWCFYTNPWTLNKP